MSEINFAEASTDKIRPYKRVASNKSRPEAVWVADADYIRREIFSEASL